MTNQEINIAIAEACGWNPPPEGMGNITHGGGKFMSSEEWRKVHIPDYCNDLNAMHDAEKVLTEKGVNAWWTYVDWINRHNLTPFGQSTAVHATAAQRAEANPMEPALLVGKPTGQPSKPYPEFRITTKRSNQTNTHIMGRSVSTHRHAVETIYLHSVVSDDAESWEWDDFIEYIRSILSKRYPSLSECERWQDREDRIILENQRAEVSVSEYCGLVAMCLAPLDPYNQLDQGWCDRVSKSFRDTLHKAFPSSALRPIGRASNGEAFFTPINRPEGVVTSKEGVLW